MSRFKAFYRPVPVLLFLPIINNRAPHEFLFETTHACWFTHRPFSMPLVTVFCAFNPADAQLVRSRLEAAEFHPVVMHELSSLSLDGYAMAAGGILVQVPEEELADAREFLEDPGDAS